MYLNEIDNIQLCTDCHRTDRSGDYWLAWEIMLIVVDDTESRGVNRAEISGQARKILFSARPGPARNQCIIKFVLYNFLKYYSKINIIT